MKNPLKNKKMLITAGPTWVPIDSVRVISNISTGEMGLLLAKKAADNGAIVDLCLGPIGSFNLDKKIHVFRFTYFSELFAFIKRGLKKKKYDVILHAAAVSDYLTHIKRGKISSKKNSLVLKLKRAPKIIKVIRQLNSKAYLVMFKFETGVSDSLLIKRAQIAMKQGKADMVIANTIKDGKYKGYILNGAGLISKSLAKEGLSQRLIEVLKKKVQEL